MRQRSKRSAVEALSSMGSQRLGRTGDGVGWQAQWAVGCRELPLSCSCSGRRVSACTHRAGYLHRPPTLKPQLLTHSRLTCLEQHLGKHLIYQRHPKIKEVPKATFKLFPPSHILPSPPTHTSIRPIHLPDTNLGKR